MKANAIKLILIGLCLALLNTSGCRPSINNGTIEYDHNLTFNYGGIQMQVRVTGEVPFFSKEAYLNPQTSMYSGVGSVNDTLSGTTPDCIISGSGTNKVTCVGNEFLGTITFTTTETWYNPGSFTMTCPDKDPPVRTTPLPAQTITQQIVFKAQDEAVYEQPCIGDFCSGTYKWILHQEM